MIIIQLLFITKNLEISRFFMNGFLTVGYEFGAELTYPHAESTTSGLLNAAGELCGVALVLISGLILEDWGDLPTNIMLTTVLIIGLGLSFPISRNNLRRLAASNNRSAANFNGTSNSEQKETALETIAASSQGTKFGNTETISTEDGLHSNHFRSNGNVLHSVTPAINGISDKSITQKPDECTINSENNCKTIVCDQNKNIHLNKGYTYTENIYTTVEDKEVQNTHL